MRKVGVLYLIYEIMNSVNNHFVRNKEYGISEIVADGIIGDFQNRYIKGQYIVLKNTFLNDNVYKILEVSENKLTLDGVLEEEITEEAFCLYSLSVPIDFLTLCEEIKEWQSKHGCNTGIASEGIDDYSVSFDTSNGGTWKGAFKNRLNTYRKMYPDLK